LNGETVGEKERLAGAKVWPNFFPVDCGHPRIGQGQKDDVGATHGQPLNLRFK
jgi:hypothetical protein